MATIDLLERTRAVEMIHAALKIAQSDDKAPVTIGVAAVDGVLIALERMDGAQPLGVGVVIAKLHTAVVGKKDTIERSGKGVDPTDFNDSLFTTLGGGVVLRQNGHIVGAMAVSGRAPEDDHALATQIREQFGY